MAKRLIFMISVALEAAIWPVGIWMMVTGYDGHSPDEIGKAMATVILVLAIPIFMTSCRPT